MVEHEELKINAPSYSKKEGVEGLDERLQDSFVSLLIGKPGSGKSHLITELLLRAKFYRGRFNYIFFVTPSNMELLELQPDINWCVTFDLNWIMSKIKQINQLNKKGVNCLFVLDDVIAQINKLRDHPDLNALFFNRRHLIKGGTISLIVTTQKYIVCPPRVRSVLTNLFVFKTQTMDWKKIKEECYFGSENSKLDKVAAQHFITPHNFFYFNLSNGSCYANFELIPEDAKQQQQRKGQEEQQFKKEDVMGGVKKQKTLDTSLDSQDDPEQQKNHKDNQHLKEFILKDLQKK